jgi:PAS domain S-box
MKLRGKILIIIALIIILVTMSFLVISQTIFSASSTETENQYTTMVLNNTLHALNNDLSSLNKTANDWSQYDAAYEFVRGNNPNFIERSLLDATFLRLNLNLIIFTNNDGEILFAKAINLQTEEEIPLPANLTQEITNNLTQNQEDNAGFASINGTPMIMVSKPVLRSDGQGPSQGTLLMGRYLNEFELETLSNNVNISIIPVSVSNIPSGFQNTTLILDDSPTYIEIKNTETIAGYSLLNGISGKPSLILKVEIPRMIYKTYEKAIFYLILSIVIVGIIGAILVYFNIDKNLLRRLDKITNSVMEVKKTNDLSSRIPVLGNDELADLAVSVNEMLQSLQRSKIKLEKSEEEYRTIFENTGTAMLIVSADLDILLVNSEFQRIFGFKGEEYNKKENLMDYVVEGDMARIKEINHALMENQDPHPIQNSEFKLFNRKNEVRDFFTTFGYIPRNNETLISFIDVTEHNKAVLKIKNSLKEKEILLREIHHRVKNNLQIISALLMLQADETEDSELLLKYKESENRIHSMALIHERMYQSQDLSSIDFKEYINSLIHDLTYSYGFDSNQQEIMIDVGDFSLSIETVMPMGLIVNELVSNSLKYAFKDFDDKPQIIGVKLQSVGENSYKLEIWDNGKGIPENIDFKNTSTLGLQLVNELTKQLDGRIEVIVKDGTRFKIIFKEPEYKKRL